jgi:inactive STAND/CHAT domain
MPDLPLIFFAFANATDKTEFLPHLKEEERGILELCTPLKHLYKILDFEHREQTQAKDLFDILSQVGKKVSILHYSGHANSLSISLDDDQFSIERLCLLIGSLENLQLVFLNGCSTGKMVDLLLENGVKAVIATSQEVADVEACRLSLAFYKSLSVKDKTLENAFTDALSVLSKNPVSKAEAFVSRGTMKRDKLAEKDKIPWALYYRETDKQLGTVLDIRKWTLVRQEATTDIDFSLQQKIESIHQEIALHRQKIQGFEAKIKPLQDAITQLGLGNPISKGLQLQVDENEALIAQAAKELDASYTRLKTILKSHDQLELADRFKKALFHLNFQNQLRFFQQKFANNTIAAYLLQGSPKCGQDILRNNLLDMAGFRSVLKNEFYHQAMVDFGSQSTPPLTVNGIWTAVKEQFTEVKATEPAGIVSEIYDKYFKHKSVVFIFNNIHQTSPDFNKDIIEKFWFSFLETFLSLHKDKTITSKLLLFIVDKNCQITAQGNEVLSDKELSLKQLLKQEDLDKYPTHIVPVITPLKATELSDWQINQRLPLELGLTEELLNEALGFNTGQKAYMLPTIKTLCEKANMLAVYNDYFRQYEYKLPEL